MSHSQACHILCLYLFKVVVLNIFLNSIQKIEVVWEYSTTSKYKIEEVQRNTKLSNVKKMHHYPKKKNLLLSPLFSYFSNGFL